MHRVSDGGWDKAFQAKGKPLNRSWSCDNVLDSAKSYVSKRPDDIKVSVSAAAALLYLHERRQLQLARHAWQTQARRPHAIIRKRPCAELAVQEGSASASAVHGELLFFVIACGSYVARVCPVRRVTKELLALDFRQWSWLVLANVQEWDIW